MSSAGFPAGWPEPIPDARPVVCDLALDPGSARLSLCGELDLLAEPQLASLLDRCVGDAALVVVDLSAVEFLSCGALHLLLSASRRTRATGGRFVVVRGRRAVERLFDVIGVDLEFELVDTPPSNHRLPRSWDPDRWETAVGEPARRSA